VQMPFAMPVIMGSPPGGGPPASGKLHQSLLTKSTGGLSIGGVLTDQRSGLGTARPIQPGRCLDMVGAGDTKGSVTAFVLPQTADFSVCCWLMGDTLTDNMAPWSQWDAGDTGSMRCYLNQISGPAYRVQVQFDNGGGGVGDGDSADAQGIVITSGVWYWVYFQRITDAISIYANDTFYQTKSITAGKELHGDVFRIGCRASSIQHTWDGRLFDMRVFGRVLTAAEQTAIYTQGLEPWHRVSGQPQDPIGQWYLDDDNSTTHYDSSGNGNDGTIVDFDVTMNYEGSDVPWSPQNLIGYSDD
jgi:hypothetical protein